MIRSNDVRPSQERGALRRRLIVLAALAALWPATAGAQEVVEVDAASRGAVALTLYATGSSLIREERAVDLPDGDSLLSVTDLPDAIDPSSLRLVLRGGGDGAALGALTFPGRMITPASLLQAHLGQTLSWISPSGDGEETVRRGRLISLSGGVTIDFNGRIETNPPGRPAFEDIPEAMVSRLTVHAPVSGAAAGEGVLDLRYLTGGLSWQADYIAEVNEAMDRLDLQGFATLTNGTDQRFEAARVTLFAGDINRVSRTEPMMMEAARDMPVAAVSAAAPAPPEAAEAGDFHRYDLREPATLPPASTVRLPLTGSASVPVEKVYRLEPNSVYLRRPMPGAEDRQNPSIILTFDNDAAAGLGMALPAGAVRVYSDQGPATVLLGEDRIGHTARDQEVELTLGRAFDVTATRRQTAFRRFGDDNRAFEAAMEITLENARDEAVTVEVIETFNGEWRILDESQPHERRDAFHPVWQVTVPGGGTAELTYTVSLRF